MNENVDSNYISDEHIFHDYFDFCHGKMFLLISELEKSGMKRADFEKVVDNIDTIFKSLKRLSYGCTDVCRVGIRLSAKETAVFVISEENISFYKYNKLTNEISNKVSIKNLETLSNNCWTIVSRGEAQVRHKSNISFSHQDMELFKSIETQIDNITRGSPEQSPFGFTLK